MVGLDVSAKLLKIAKQRSSTIQVVMGDMRFLPFKTQAFKAAVSMDTSFGYLPSEKDDAQSLAEVRRVLERDATLVVDVFNRQQLIAKYHGKNPSSKWREYPSFLLLQKRAVSQNGNWLCDSWIVRSKDGGQLGVFEHTVRLYEFRGLQGLLVNAGFVVDRVYGDYEMQAFSPNSSRLILVADAK
jgi:ubiquinone/menaquinone biosynthesis C-methylase UbiE